MNQTQPSPWETIGLGTLAAVLAIFAALAAIGSFVAFGPGTRSFSVSVPIVSTSGGSEIFGRVAFGVGAIIAWLCLILVAVGGWRKLMSRNRP